MEKVVRLLAILIVLVAASAVPSSAIIPNCSEFCSCEVGCDWGCWDRATSSGTNCGDWGICSGLCGGDAARGKVDQGAWLVSGQTSGVTHPNRPSAWTASCTTGAAATRPYGSAALH